MPRHGGTRLAGIVGRHGAPRERRGLAQALRVLAVGRCNARANHVIRERDVDRQNVLQAYAASTRTRERRLFSCGDRCRRDPYSPCFHPEPAAARRTRPAERVGVDGLLFRLGAFSRLKRAHEDAPMAGAGEFVCVFRWSAFLRWNHATRRSARAECGRLPAKQLLRSQAAAGRSLASGSPAACAHLTRATGNDMPGIQPFRSKAAPAGLFWAGGALRTGLHTSGVLVALPPSPHRLSRPLQTPRA